MFYNSKKKLVDVQRHYAFASQMGHKLLSELFSMEGWTLRWVCYFYELIGEPV